MKLRHRLFLLFSGILCVTALTAAVFSGCAHAGTGAAPVRAIPADGVVRKAELAALQKSGRTAIYRGTSGGIVYEWTFAGQNIQKAADANLQVTFHPADETAMGQQAGGDVFAYRTASQAALPGDPSLSIAVGNGWSDGSYSLYSWSDGRSAAAGTALVTGGTAALSHPAMGEAYLLQSQPISPAASAPAAAASSAAASSTPAASSAPAKAKSAPSAAPSGPGNSPSAASQPDRTVSDPTAIQVTLTIRCDTAVSKISDRSIVPADGVILPATGVTMHQGDTVYALLKTVCQAKKIQFDKSGNEISKTVYIKSINNLKEMECGSLSGWVYSINGDFSDKGVSQQTLTNGADVKFLYTCNMGKDLH